MDSSSAWREERREALAAQAAALNRRRAAETTQARELIARFVRDMQARGAAPERLRARVPDGRTTYRTDVVGWYIRGNGSLGVGTDGRYYVLDTPRRLAARLVGVRPEPTDPPLTVGVGARDGESRPLRELLRMRLDDTAPRPD